MRTLRRRMLRLSVGATLVVAILIVAQEDLATTVLAVAGLAIAAMLWLGLRRPAVAVSIVSFVVTCVLVSEITHWIGAQLESVGPAQVGIVFWIFAFVVLAATWLTHKGRSAAFTVALAHAVLVLASFAAYLHTTAVPIVAFVLAMAVVTWRARRTRRPRRDTAGLTLESLDLSARSRGAERTRQALVDAAPDEARVVGPVKLSEGGEVEHVLLDGDLAYVVETRIWEGTVERIRLAGKRNTATEVYALNDDVRELAARTEPVVRAAQAFASEYALDVVGVIVLWDTVELTDDVVEMRADGHDLPLTYLVRGDHLAEWIRRRGRR